MRKDEGNTWRKRSRSEEKRPESCAGRGTSNVFVQEETRRGADMWVVTQDMKHQGEKRAFKGDSEEVLLDPV